MVKLFLKQRFTKYDVSQDSAIKVLQILGPLQNFIKTKVVQFINLRAVGDNYEQLRVVNRHFMTYRYEIDEYAKSFIRCYADSIITHKNYLEKNIDEDLYVKFNKLKLSKDAYLKNTSCHVENKKAIGIICKNPSYGFFDCQKIFVNDNQFKYIITTPPRVENLMKSNHLYKKYTSPKNYLDWLFIREDQEVNLDSAIELMKNRKSRESMKQQEEFLRNPSILDKLKNEQINENENPKDLNKLILIEGCDAHAMKYMDIHDPDDVPVDLFVFSIVRGGTWDANECGPVFQNLERINHNFIQMFRSKSFDGPLESTWQYRVYKKRVLVSTDRDWIMKM